jgi:hypothetical protein
MADADSFAPKYGWQVCSPEHPMVAVPISGAVGGATGTLSLVAETTFDSESVSVTIARI